MGVFLSAIWLISRQLCSMGGCTELIIRSLFSMRKPAVTALTSKYGISSASASAREIKHCLWNSFVEKSVNAGHFPFTCT